jgi:RNA polymerase sigma-54 factor
MATMKASLQFRLSQHLALTPQLQQSIRLLQLSTQELEQEVEQALADNPLLERDDEADAEQAVADPSSDMSDRPEAHDFNGYDASEILASAGAASDAADERPPLATDAQTLWDTRRDDAPDLGEAEYEAFSFDDAPLQGAGGMAEGDDELDPAANRQAGETLADHLRAQLHGVVLGDDDRALALAIVDSLDDDGLLPESPEELARAWLGLPAAGALAEAEAEAVDELAARIRIALGIVQSLDPPGVAARSLAECLVLQLRAQPPCELRRIAARICEHHLELLARRDYKRIARLLGDEVDEADVRRAQAMITTLNPRPAAAFAGDAPRAVVPDVIVTRTAGGFRASLNPDVLPKLRVNQLYAGIVKRARGDSSADHAALAGQLQEARWFIKNIQQRFDTILRVAQAIVERQRNFFTHGEAGMRPLVLKEIADTLGLHESTISRVTSNKYMATPWGTYELKFFFTSGVATDTGGSASSTAVKSLIRDLVAQEDGANPLSDNDIAERLAARGIVIARRTVAKYREALRIAPANLRRGA